MADPTNISLIDLSSQLPFEMDDAMKLEICFGETLVISCGHYDGEIGTEDSESDWSCQDSTESQVSEEIKEEKIFEVADKVIDDSVQQPEKDDDDDDFHFYFFPDCEKPPPVQESNASLLVVDGMPKQNTAAKRDILCICPTDKKGKCTCFVKLPCKCGAKIEEECTCPKLDAICTCINEPRRTCTCKDNMVCLCHPNMIRTVCTCENIEKPCVCRMNTSGLFPCAVCSCKYKPKFIEDVKSNDDEFEQTPEEENTTVPEKKTSETKHEPCNCQIPHPDHCLCLIGKACICKENTCVCGVQKSCVCQPVEKQEACCTSDNDKLVCTCKILIECTCEGKDINDCKCYPKYPCTCGDPENCKCFGICDCADPCICDTTVEDPPECICLEKPMQKEEGKVCTCICKEDPGKKLKKVRAGKHGYRWCNEVDADHTFFDYGYGRHDKITHKEEKVEKLKILGLHDEKKDESICEVHGVKAPPYKKQIRKPSIDCCSSVGGISICVESLGEDKDKFLVQVVSHSSKEGAKCSTKLVSILDCNLHTMEENRTERLGKQDLIKERKSYMAICDTGYYNKVTRICGERTVVKRHYHTYKEAENFILEGANVVLLRYIGLRRYHGNLKTATVLINGVICESIYVSNGVSQAIVNGKPLFVVKVERHIIEPSGLIHQTLTVLSLRGYMISHEWADNCYLFHINPLLNIVPERDEIETHMPLRERWRTDLQLLSDYLDFKSTRSSEGSRYVTESGALTGTVRDYLQALLLLRPNDAMHFTRHYFNAALSALDLPHDEYFDPMHKHVRYYFFEE